MSYEPDPENDNRLLTRHHDADGHQSAGRR